MNQRAIYDILSGRRRGLGATVLRGALTAASVPYGAAMTLRRAAYRRGLLPSYPASAGVGVSHDKITSAGKCPVICVGNITTGGTGKTPMTAWLVRQLAAMKRRPAILTRGYKATAGRSDEAAMLQLLCGMPVIVNADRVAGAAAAIAQGCDVLVMDDGFQHRRLRRDLDIVLVHAGNPMGFGHCLPRGLLREPLGALRDAHAIVITHSDSVNADHLANLRATLSRLAPQASQHMAVHRVAGMIAPDGRLENPRSLAGQKVFAFCGLADGRSFFDSVAKFGATLAGQLELEDHARYDAARVASISRLAAQSRATALVTTQKDVAKLIGADLGMPLWQLAIQMDVTDGAPELMAKVKALL